MSLHSALNAKTMIRASGISTFVPSRTAGGNPKLSVARNRWLEPFENDFPDRMTTFDDLMSLSKIFCGNPTEIFGQR